MNPRQFLLTALSLASAAATAVTLPPTDLPPATAGRHAALKPPDPKELPALVAKLSAPDPQDREDATRALIAAGPAARALLRKALESTDPEVRWRARYALAAIEEILDRPDHDPARELFAAAVRADGKKATTRLEELIERFPKTRWAAAAAERLARLKAARRPAPPQRPADPKSLVEKLASPEWAERQSATLRLAAMGEAAKPALEAAARSPDPEIAWRARSLLERLAQRAETAKPQPERPRSPNVVIELLGEGRQRIATIASELDTLVAQLSEDDPWQVARARLGILAVGDQALDALVRGLERADEVAAVEIMDLLQRITGCRLGFDKARWLAWWRRLQETGDE